MLAESGIGFRWETLATSVIGGLVVLLGTGVIDWFRWQRRTKLEFVNALKMYYASISCAYYAWKERENEKKRLESASSDEKKWIEARIDEINRRYDIHYKEFLASGTVLVRFGKPATQQLLKQIEDHWSKTDIDPQNKEYEEKLDALLDKLREHAS